MKKVGIICEYNPFHNGHIYHIKKVKELFPDSILILVLNGYFLERGEISILSKEDKTKIALLNGIDLVLSLPVLFGTQSADIFAEKSLEILNHFGVTDVVFGSECNDISFLMKSAKQQFNSQYNKTVKQYLKEGINYPTALNKALDSDIEIKEPNDLLGISYAKAIIKNNWPIALHTIQRTNDYHDVFLDNDIISASNIRKKVKEKKDITKYVPREVLSKINLFNEEKLWDLLKYKMITENDLSRYMDVDEGIESRIKNAVLKANDFSHFLNLIKTKRYTYNKLNRMILHILLGFTKEDKIVDLTSVQILGFNKKGQDYLSRIRKKLKIKTNAKNTKLDEYEKRAAYLYSELTGYDVTLFELENKPIIKEKSSF